MNKLLIFMTFVLLASCGSQRILTKRSQNIWEQINTSNEENDDTINELPTKSDWISSRDKTVKGWEDDLKEVEEVKSKTTKNHNVLTISSLVIGIGSGVYGLVDDENIVPSMGSMIVGGIGTLISELSLSEKKDKADKCYNTIKREIRVFKTIWSDINYPQNSDEYSNYNKSKAESVKAITLDCY